MILHVEKYFESRGFQKLSDGSWISLNVTHQKTEIQPIPNGQAILIVIGEGLNQASIVGAIVILAAIFWVFEYSKHKAKEA